MTTPRTPCAVVLKRPPHSLNRLWALAALLLLVGCREVRVQTLKTGTTPVLGANEIAVVRDTPTLERLGIHAPVRYRNEFAVVLLMGPHDRTGYRQIIESIRANPNGVRVVAQPSQPA